MEALTFDDLMPVETSFWIVRIEQTFEQVLNVRIEDDWYSRSMTLPAGGLYRTYDLQCRMTPLVFNLASARSL